MTSLTETLSEMIDVAEGYCRLIENPDEGAQRWLAALFTLMPRLHTAVTSLNAFETGDTQVPGVDLDDRFLLYSRLRKRLGDRDSYWLEFDASPEEMHMSGTGHSGQRRSGRPVTGCTGVSTWSMPSVICTP
jgi:hypothetical protein